MSNSPSFNRKVDDVIERLEDRLAAEGLSDFFKISYSEGQYVDSFNLKLIGPVGIDENGNCEGFYDSRHRYYILAISTHDFGATDWQIMDAIRKALRKDKDYIQHDLIESYDLNTKSGKKCANICKKALTVIKRKE